MGMSFKLIIALILTLVLVHTILNVSATIWLRYFNPMKRLPNNNTIYLTFDDGINAENTPMLLDLLKKYNVKATFFMVANTLDENSGLLERMKQEGHIIGFHSWSHKNQILQNIFAVLNDFKRSTETFEQHGISPIYYRPPWGHISLLGLWYCKLNGLKITLWNVIVQDWQKNTSPEIICEKLTKKVKGNSVACLHDGRGKNDAPQKTIKALNEMIPMWIEEGYSFETIDKFYEKNIT